MVFEWIGNVNYAFRLVVHHHSAWLPYWQWPRQKPWRYCANIVVGNPLSKMSSHDHINMDFLSRPGNLCCNFYDKSSKRPLPFVQYNNLIYLDMSEAERDTGVLSATNAEFGIWGIAWHLTRIAKIWYLWAKWDFCGTVEGSFWDFSAISDAKILNLGLGGKIGTSLDNFGTLVPNLGPDW